MSKSQRLRLSDVKQVYRGLDQCQELWADPAGWQEHLLDILRQLCGGHVAVYLGMEEVRAGAPVGFNREACDVGWEDDPKARAIYEEARAEGRFATSPGFERAVDLLCQQGKVTRPRRGYINDQGWYGSDFYHEVRLPTGRDDFLASFRYIWPWDGAAALINVNREPGDPPFGRRSRRVFSLLHDELGPRIGTRLATRDHRCLAGLSPQLREVLQELLLGESEKGIADRLTLSPITVHDHVQTLYHHFEVQQDSELMAYFIRRRPMRKRASALGPGRE